jgi:hypothetical protein
MRWLFTIALSAVALAQPQYVALTSGQMFTFNPPQPTVTNVREEFRLTITGPPASTTWVFNDNSFACYIPAGTTNLDCHDYADSGAGANIITNTLLDMRVRLQRVGGSSGLFTTEIWPASGAVAGYVWSQNTFSGGGSFTFNGGQTGCPIGGNFGSPNGGNIGFVRAYSNTLPLYSLPPAENPASKGDIYDFEFQGNANDSSGRGLTLTLNTGSASYAANTVYAPQASFRAYVTTPSVFYAAMPPSFRATTSITLDGSFAFDSQNDIGIPSLFWQQLSGPSIGTFSSRTVQQPSFSASLAGNYAIQLTATDSSGAVASTTVSVGAVATDANHVVITPNGSLWDKIMQAVMMAGTTPWPYFDITNYVVATTNANYASTNYLPALGPQIDPSTCTVTSITNEGFNITGSGCHWATDGILTVPGSGSGACYDNVTTATASSSSTTLTVASNSNLNLTDMAIGAGIPLGSKITNISGNTITISIATTAALPAGTQVTFVSTSCLIIAWNTIDGPNTGRAPCAISSISDNAISCTYDGAAGIVKSGSGSLAATVYYVGPYSVSGDPWICGGDTANQACPPYYDGALAMYRNYFATGLAFYLNMARFYADQWWQWGFDHGNANPFPRSLNIMSQILRALDGHPERFGGAANGGPGSGGIYATMYWFMVQDPFYPPGIDNRESGAVLMYDGALALADPDATRHAQYCSWLQSDIPLWITAANATTAGYAGENIFIGSAPNYPFASVSTAQPSAAPWRSMVWGPMGMEFAYLAVSNSSDSDCYNATLASEALNFISKGAQAIYAVGRGNNSGVPSILYNINSITNGVDFLTGTGTVSATLGSPSVVGISTTFTTMPAVDGVTLCGGSGYIAFAGSGSTDNDTIYKVSSCADNTHLTLATNYGTGGVAGGAPNETQNLSGASWTYTAPENTGCPGSAATGYQCPTGNIDLTSTPPGVLGWAANNTSCGSTCLTYGDIFFGTQWGGPADGPGGVLPCQGPQCTNQQTYVVATLPGCNVTSPPCGQGYSPVNGKNYAEGAGNLSSMTYPAARIGGVAAVAPRTLTLSFVLPSGATTALVTMTTPAGVTSTTSCSSSPCSVSGADARQSSVIVQISYKSSGGAIIAQTDPFTVTAIQ